MSDSKLYAVARGVFRSCVITLNHAYYLSYLTWIVLIYPLKWCCLSHIFYKLEGRLQYGMLRMVAMWIQWAGYEVYEAGDDFSECLDEKTLLLVNHQSTADVLMLFNAFATRSRILPNVMWIMDRFLKYSHFGIVSAIHKDFFIDAGKEKREKSLEKLSKHLQDYYVPLKRTWMILFPEGGFLYKRKESSQRYGRKNNLPHLEYVTIPRMGAMQVIMNTLNSKNSMNNNCTAEMIPSHQLKYILDVTIAYPNGDPLDMLNILLANRPPCKTIIYYRLYHIREAPQNNEGLTKWVLDRWIEKERMLETYYGGGDFPSGKPPTLVRQNLFNYSILHVAFLTSIYVQYHIFRLAYQYCCNFLVG